MIGGGHEGEEKGQQGYLMDETTLEEEFIFAEVGTVVGPADFIPTVRFYP